MSKTPKSSRAGGDQKQVSAAVRSTKLDRETRLAAALRENLVRRKQQARARREEIAPETPSD